MQTTVQRIEISYKTIVFTVFFLLSLWIVYQVRDVIFLFLFSIVVMAGMRPFVDALERMRIPRPISILIVYVFLFTIIGFGVFLIVPPLVSQSQKLLDEIGAYLSFLLPFIDLSAEKIAQQIPSLSQNVFKITTGIFSSLFGLFSFFIFTFYFLLERHNLRKFLNNFVGCEAEKTIIAISRKVEKRLSSWVLGQVLLMFIIGLATYLGLTLLGVDLALSLAIIAGILEIVPILGPVISSIPAILVALTVSPVLAIAVGVLYFVIQQIENNLIVPLVMRKAVGLPPLVTIVALMIGGKLAGIGGIVLSVPLLVASQVIFRELFVTYESRARTSK